MQLHHQLAATVETAVFQAQQAGDLPPFDIPDIPIEQPRDPSHGDYASPIAMQLARLARMAPLKIAQAITTHLPPRDYLAAVEVAPPGFINFRLATAWLQNLVAVIIEEGGEYGRLTSVRAKKPRSNASAPIPPAPSPWAAPAAASWATPWPAPCGPPVTTSPSNITTTTPAARSPCWANRPNSLPAAFGRGTVER
jgi:hypothetical protein